MRDVSHQDSEAQSHDVEDVLRQLGIEPGQGTRLIEVWNKIDRLDADRRASDLRNLAERAPGETAGGTGVRPDRGGVRPAH